MGVARRAGDGFDVVFERPIAHPPARVWAMVTEPERIATWYCARVDMDRRLGGSIVEHHDHVGVDVHGRVTRWEPPRRFEHTLWFDDTEPGPRGTVDWQLFPDASGTRLVLTHRRKDLDAGGIAGAHAALDVLCAVLDGADPRAHAAPEGAFRDGAFVETHRGRGRWADREELQQEYERAFASL
jgi:uncharacterized protein YndB with AHSA1/START domain